jgi:hypothetical protein
MTKSGEQDSPSHVPSELIALGTYEWPRSETRQTLGRLFDKIKTVFRADVSENAVDAERLKLITDDVLKANTYDLLASILHSQLDTAYLDWANTAENGPRRRAFVHPPMDQDHLADWADLRGFAVLKPSDSLDDFDDATCVVIPKLEKFFSRDYNQLSPLFELFDAMTRFDGKIIVGCNSWAWQFLKQFDDALLLFGTAQTVPAFDADALADIFDQALSKTENRQNFMSVESGDPILERDKDGALKDPYLEHLAGLSLGLPWVAIEMFFKGIAETKDEEKSSGNSIWVKLPTSCSLPVSGSTALSFALQALLIHGSRSSDDLDQRLPHRIPNGVWTELERTGFVEIQDGYIQCAVSSYPDIRSELGAAGFNLDKL